jgi:circadian clock protein KaiC
MHQFHDSDPATGIARQAGVALRVYVAGADLSPGEFSGLVRQSVEAAGARVVVIDSLTGYLNAMPEEEFVALQMHELLTYLNQQGVVTILILAQHGMVGQMATPIDMTYLSNSVVLMRLDSQEADGLAREHDP